MLYIEDLKIQITKKLRVSGFCIGARDVDQYIKFPYIELSVDSDGRGNTKSNIYHEVSMNIDIIANGDDEEHSKINELQQNIMKLLHSEYKGDEHHIIFQGFENVQYLDEEDEKYNIYRRVILCKFIIQTNNF